jgi:tetratricopeptide (TPR) repeat protein
VLVLLIAGIYHRSALSAWYANLGTIAQAQIEIPAYLSDDWQNTTIDKVRQVGDLGPVLSAYQRALSTDPTNLTALQRMADIELSRGQYEQALQHISEAWQAGRRDDVTRLLYGDALVANGLPEQAAQVVRGIVDAEVRLMYQAVYRYFFSGDYPRAGDAWRTVLLLNPQSSQARKGLVDVQRRLNNPSGSSVVPDGTLPPNP